MHRFEYDLFVIGGGSGGVRAGRVAAQRGLRVAIAEERNYGGTCVNRGCVPKKLFVYAAEFAHDFEDAAGFGWTVGERTFDWQTLIHNKNQEITRDTDIDDDTKNWSKAVLRRQTVAGTISTAKYGS